MAPELEELREKMEEVTSHFDRMVAVTMAIVAAVLATVTMLSHRADNETLLLQSDANRLQTEAGILHTQATDQWNFYQAKNIRNSQFQGFLGLISALAVKPGPNPNSSRWLAEVQKYEKELPEIQAHAQDLSKKATETQRQAQGKLEESYRTHEKGERYDLAELAVELSLVLCSLAVLTKRGPFWYSGMVVGAVGAALTAMAFVS